MLEVSSQVRKLVLTALPNTSPLNSNSCLSGQSWEADLGSFSGFVPAPPRAPFLSESEGRRSLKQGGCRERCASTKGMCSPTRCLWEVRRQRMDKSSLTPPHLQVAPPASLSHWQSQSRVPSLNTILPGPLPALSTIVCPQDY